MTPEERCPVCTAALGPDDERCPSCGSASGVAMHRLSRALGVGGDATPDSPAATSPGSPVLFLCPGCGAFVSVGDAQCGQCGTSLSTALRELDRFLGATQKCRYCGDTVPAGAPSCPTCGNSLEPPRPRAFGPPTTRVCPSCGSAVLPSESRCGVCGAAMSGPKENPRGAPRAGCPACGTSVEPGATTCPACGVRILEPATAGEPAEVRPAGMPSDSTPSAKPPQDRKRIARPVAAVAPSTPSIRPRPGSRPGPKPTSPARSTSQPAMPRSPGRPPVDAKLSADGALEIAVYSTLPTGPAIAAATILESAVGAWVVLAGLATLLAAGVALLAMSSPRPRLGPRWTIAVLAGAALLTVPPVLALAGVSASLPNLSAIALAGSGLLLAVVARRRTFPEAFAPWCATLPALLASVAVLVRDPRIGATTAAATWAAASVPIAATLLLLARRRWSQRTVRRSLERGRQDYANRDVARSLQEFDRAIAAAGTTSEADAAWYSKGAALIALGRYEEAIACLDTALKINPNNEAAWLNRGNALTKLGRLVDALRSYNAALKVNPGYEIAWNNKGNALARMGRFREALACYDRALAIDASYKAAWVNKGFALTKMGQFEEAARCADRAARLAPEFVR